ncbi:PTS lactose/cellobiose transporter subunit IIA [Propionibacterium cyclohexanicum]|nr:PTS lactose/cellobiose transporter subunit IIA [Propionibacterium cyclohexanicum]
MDDGRSGAPAGASSQPDNPTSELSTFSFRIIALAGEAHSLAVQSIRASQHSDFAEAGTLLERAEARLTDCHEVQTEALTAHARGEQLPVDILLIHAQDHLSMASTMIEDAQVFLDIYRRLATSPANPIPLEE